jgi:ATP-dependent Lon protease
LSADGKAMQENKQILLVSQKEADLDDPHFDELHKVGTLANILQLLKLPDGTVKVLVEGEQRSQVKKYHISFSRRSTISAISSNSCFSATFRLICAAMVSASRAGSSIPDNRN